MKLKLIVLLTLPLLAANVARADDSDVKGLDYYMDPPSQSDDEADVTGSMLNDAAHTIGFRGGKAERAKEIRAALENQRSNLDYMYSFQPLISSEGYLPPALVVGHIIIFQQLLTDIEVTAFHFTLGVGDRLGDPRVLNRLTWFHSQFTHHARHAIGGEDTHQGIFH